MKAGIRLVLWTSAFLALNFTAPTRPADASPADLDFHNCAYAFGLGEGECQHFLRNPAGPTDDPCWCDKCRNGITGQRHDGKTIPPGWNPTLFEIGGMDAYLKRHSLAWGITCSECLQSDKPWPDGGATNMGTIPEKDFAGRFAKGTVLARLTAEKRLFKKPEDVVLAYDRHFYLATDVGGLKVRTPGGSSRVVTKHEWLHLMIERAGFARREWVRNMGEPIVMKGTKKRPIAIYIPDRLRDFSRIGAEYFKSAGSNGLRGPIAELCDKMCLTGMTFAREECGDDQTLVVYMRHQISHSLLSIWGSLEVRPKSMPVWLDEGLAHWLTKSLERYRGEVFYCVGEGLGGPSAAGGPAWSGGEWEKDLVRWVQTGKLRPIEEMFGKQDLQKLTEEDQKRAWSYFDICLAEWRDPFVRMMSALRKEKLVREAFTDNLQCTPEIFDERWRERVLGRRKSMAPNAADAAADSNEAPGARDRKSLLEESDPKVLAAKLRALGEVKDKKTTAVVVDVIEKNSDLVRETAFVALLKTTDKECLDLIWNYGLAHADGMVRAYAARLCGRLKLHAALPKLEAQLEDKNWLARAEAAVACGLMKDVKAMAAMRKIVLSDPSDKTKVGAVDALAMFGEDASTALPLIAKHLDSSQWQLRIAAAQALGEMGNMEAVEPLIARMEKETGRVSEEIHQALMKITRDDLGRKAAHWRKWWEGAKAAAPGGMPGRPPSPDEKAKPKGPDPNDPRVTSDRPPPYFGIELYSNRIAFIIDTTETMLMLFTPDPAGAKALSREYLGRDKLGICKEEIEQALSTLDPRAHFNIVAFGMQIRSFKSNPVPASPGNIEAANGFLKSLAGAGRTNYYGALKAALDIGRDPDTNPDFRATPDTITFLTDGMPNEGDITEGDTIVEWYTGLNRYARVKTHTITFGTINVDTPLLRGMAERNGGRFILVPEKKGSRK